MKSKKKSFNPVAGILLDETAPNRLTMPLSVCFNPVAGILLDETHSTRCRNLFWRVSIPLPGFC